MNFGPRIFIGAFITFLAAWIGLVLLPSHTLSDLKAVAVEGTTLTNPRLYTGAEQKGREIYQREGCVYCHSQQVRGGKYNNDIERGWGPRRSHPQDYIYDYPVLLGTMRTGPDLLNIGARQPSADWHYKHLYDPQKVSPGSIMAPFRYLFDVRKIIGQPSADAIHFEPGYVPAGYEIVPTADAQNLVSYLKSMDHTYEVKKP